MGGVAERLKAQLLEMPGRFRYDGVRVGAGTASGEAGVDVSFEGVVCGARRFDTVDLRLVRAASGAHLELRPDASGRLPVLSVPVPEAPASLGLGLRLAVGPGASVDGPVQPWTMLSLEDRQFVVRMLDALDGAVQGFALRDQLSQADRELVASSARDTRRLATPGATSNRLAAGVRSRVGHLIGGPSRAPAGSPAAA